MNNNPIPSSDPLQIDPGLNNQYPNWIRFYDTKKKFWQLNILKIMRESQYDLIHAYVELPLFAFFSRKKYIVTPQGSDLREMVFSNSIKGILLRKAYQNAQVIAIPGVEGFTLIKKLKLKNGIFIPAIQDVNLFLPKNLGKEKYEDKLVIFSPTTHNKNKGNEILIQGFAKFVKEHKDSILILVNTGSDLLKSKKLIDTLDITNKVDFVNGPLNYEDLKNFFNLSDIVADQFLVGELGGIAREAMCCKKPLITFFLEEVGKELYGELPPIANASTPDSVYEKLVLLLDEKNRRDLGEKARNWILKYHSNEIIAKKIKNLYIAINNGKKLDEIREILKH
jgi:glycosyltransferase involved in cell wall biosynthesis